MQKPVRHTFYLLLWCCGTILGGAVIFSGFSLSTHIGNNEVLLIHGRWPDILVVIASAVCLSGTVLEGWKLVQSLRR